MEKIKNQLQVSVSKGSFVDEGDGLVSFPGGLTITDDTQQRNGTKYDINSMDVSRYGQQLTADHVDKLSNLIGRVIGVAKQGNRVIVTGIQYAVKENPYARMAYDLFVGGFSNSFSIETMGPYPDEQDRIYYNAELVGLSQVVLPNNYNAVVNQFNEIVHNSLERSKSDGLDTTGIEEHVLSQIKNDAVEEESMTKEEKEKLAVEEAAKIEAQAAAEKAANDAAEAEAKAEEEKKALEAKEAEAKAAEEAKAKAEAEELAKKEAEAKEAADKEAADKAAAEAKAQEEAEAKVAEEAAANAAKEKELNNKEKTEMTKEEIAEIVANSVAAALKPVQEELAAAKAEAKQALDAAAKEPAFRKEEEEAAAAQNAYDDMTPEELFSKQLNAAVAVERLQSVEGAKTLHEINARNLNALKEAKLVKNSMTLQDLGNFVIAPELYNEIATKRNDYSALLNITNWKETNSLQFGWLTRSSDIDMQNVAIGALGDVPSPDTTNNRLKPVSTPGYGANTDKLEEMAAVTPISINVIKFAAADILGDVAEGYRNDYDRKRAQLVIARLQQAVNANGKVQTMDISDGLLGWAQTVALAADATSTGTLVFNNKTKAFLIGQAVSTNNAAVLQEIANGTIFGTPFVTVPNDLLPTINTAETRTFQVQGQPVTVVSSVFYGDLSTFTGRTSGGLQYDVDGSASYEVGGVTYSAYQRNEVVLRGSFFRGGVVKDTRVIAAINAVAVS